MSDLRLRVNGREYGGWKRARVTRGIESIAGGFELDVSDRWAEQEKPWPIYEEDECALLLSETPVITGYVDRRSVSYGNAEHTLSVSGRDKAGALVDCSAMLGKWEFANVPLLDLAQKLCEPHGVTVQLDTSVNAQVSLKAKRGGGHITSAGSSGRRGGTGLPNPPKKFSIDPGESAFEVLDKACRLAGVLPVSDGLGGLRLTRSGSERVAVALVEGENILGAAAEYDASARYRQYLVLGQHQGSDEWSGLGVAAVRGEAQDLSIRRSARALLIRPEAAVTTEHARRRAEWEAKVRAARGDAITVRVQGWEVIPGTIWPVNALVAVRSPFLGVDGDLLITQATYSLDDGEGSVTTLTLRRPDAFLPEPTISATGGGGIWKEIARGV